MTRIVVFVAPCNCNLFAEFGCVLLVSHYERLCILSNQFPELLVFIELTGYVFQGQCPMSQLNWSRQRFWLFVLLGFQFLSVSATSPLCALLALQQKDVPGFLSRLDQVSDPDHPDYGTWLSPQQVMEFLEPEPHAKKSALVGFLFLHLLIASLSATFILSFPLL